MLSGTFDLPFSLPYHGSEVDQLLHQSVSVCERVEEVLHLHERDLLLDACLSCYLTLCVELSPEHKLLGQLCCVVSEFGLCPIKKQFKLVVIMIVELMVLLSLLQELF